MVDYNVNIYANGVLDNKTKEFYDLVIIDRFSAEGKWIDKKRFYIKDEDGIFSTANMRLIDGMYNNYPDNAKIAIRTMMYMEAI